MKEVEKIRLRDICVAFPGEVTRLDPFEYEGKEGIEPEVGLIRDKDFCVIDDNYNIVPKYKIVEETRIEEDADTTVLIIDTNGVNVGDICVVGTIRPYMNSYKIISFERIKKIIELIKENIKVNDGYNPNIPVLSRLKTFPKILKAVDL